MPNEADLALQLTTAVEVATNAEWRVVRSRIERGCVYLTVEAGGPSPELPLLLQLEIGAPEAGERCYRVVGDLAFSYRLDGGSLPRTHHPSLDRVVAALAAVASRSGFHPAVDRPRDSGGASVEPRPRAERVVVGRPVELRLGTFPTPYHRAHLESEAPLAPELIEAYRRDGHVLVRRALHRDVVLAARPVLLEALERRWPRDLPPVDERPDAYSQSFTQITDMGLRDPLVALFSHARRISRMAADLMGVRAVRSFCEDWLIKEPGARITPWHQDEAVFPFDAAATVTCWIPLQDVRAKDGLLRFARGSHRMGVAPIEDISDVSESEFAEIIARHGFPTDELPEVYAGDVSFHNGRTIHGAFPNTGHEWRVVLALHCFADGARLKKPETPKMAQIFAGSAPGRMPGDPAVSECWPLLYDGAAVPRRASTSPSPGRRYHLRATLLPTGDAPTDVWIDEGRIRFDEVAGAEELAPPGAFVTPGLVDCHCHISYPHDRGEPVDTQEWMNARRAEHTATGVLLLRDMGAVDDAISSLADVPGLARVQAAGNMILRDDQFPFTLTEPTNLVRACVERIAKGARWTKIFADWSSDYRGRINSGFTDRDEVTYAPGLLAEAVAAVHALGGRVAAHAFTRAGAEVSIRAGVDSLEHGWGVDEALIGEMVERGVAWVPLVGIAPNMWRIARREREPERVEWIERTMSSLARLLPLAQQRGVRIFAGTDLFPEVTVGDEVRQLAELGIDRVSALASGSWAARAWLGEPGLVEGAPADLVLYLSDPRVDLGSVFRPALILSGGEHVRPSLAHVRPRHSTWAERASLTGSH